MIIPVINFYIDFPISWNKKDLKIFKYKVKYIAQKIFSLENQICDVINLNLTDDSKIKDLNKKYLNHNYETDVLTFKYDNDFTEADVIISVETVKSNARKFKTTLMNELFRVIIHGILHICDYSDKTRKEKMIMRQKEDFYLKFLKDFENVSRKNS